LINPITGPDFAKGGGLLPAIAQDAQSGQVLMLAWMNAEAYAETLRTGRAVYYSRSRGKLWRKGEESGHIQRVRGIFIDCDADTILLEVEQAGAACHEGYRSCFFRAVTPAGVTVVSERLVDPGTVYPSDREDLTIKSTPTPLTDSGMRKRALIGAGYFAFLLFAFSGSGVVPLYSAFLFISLAVCGLMILALILGVYYTTTNVRQARQVNLLTVFLFTAAMAMLLGAMTGMVRAAGPHLLPLTPQHWIVLSIAAFLLYGLSLPFAGYLAESVLWCGVSVVQRRSFRNFVRRVQSRLARPIA
jgi:phosphoribosyl-AMP cyclohydrolase